MPLPPFDADGNLPPGIHSAAWDEFRERFGGNERRQTLLVGLRTALDSLCRAGCRTVYVDGSFVTFKEEPGDFDACWDAEGVDPDQLDPELLTFDRGRAVQKAKYGGELFVADWVAEQGSDGMLIRFLDFFQRDKRTGHQKGIVVIDLQGELL